MVEVRNITCNRKYCLFASLILFLPAPLTIKIEVKWELRWEDKEDAEIHGPFTSEKMLQWQESGYFSKGGFVRKTTDPGQTWYTTRRIDFDLYV